MIRSFVCFLLSCAVVISSRETEVSMAPKSVEELAVLTHTEPEFLIKLLNVLTHVDLVEEVSMGVFTNTEKGSLLRKNNCWFSLARPLLKPIIEEVGQFVINGITMTLMAEEITDTEKEEEFWNTYREQKRALEKNTYETEEKDEPRFDGQGLGSDPSKCPEEGFEWKGKGTPESGRGNWYNPKTGEKLHPDLVHPAPKGPHWGYVDAEGIEYDLFPDGSWK